MSERDDEFAAYFAARSDAMRRTAYLLCGDWHRAEDTVQTAFTKLYVAWGRIRDRGAVEPYVRRMVVTTLIDEGRLARFRREAVSGRVPESPAGTDLAAAAGDRLTVLAALARIPPRQRAVLVLRY